MSVNRDSMTLARRIRAHALRMVHASKSSHIGSCLSAADLLAVLYRGILRVRPKEPGWVGRDRFIFSKGHAAAALYAVLAESGFFSPDLLESYCADGSILQGHVSSAVPGVELSTGSLGHGLPVACGLCLAAKRDGQSWRSFVLMSDGEMDEGSNWEAILFAAHHRLDNLVALVDCNGLQGFGRTQEIMNLEPLADKWCAFGWSVRQVDGHDHGQISRALEELPFEPERPGVILARTVKGKGVSFMENQMAWHYRSPDSELLDQALRELEEDS